MKQQTINTLKEIVRYFIGCYNRGNAVTANTNTIHNEVCKQLRIVRQANKNNYRAVVVESLRILKKNIVLFETVTPKENDVLNRAVPIDNRTVYGLTNAVEDYITRPNQPSGSITTDRYITELLQHFDVLPKPENSAPPEPEPEEVGVPLSSNVERLVATINNASSTWPTRATPSDLMAGLYALYTADPDIAASAAKLGWPESKKKNYAAVCAVLKQHGLLAPVSERTRKQGNREVSWPHGIRLTPLGLEVAIAGGFKDNRPVTERSNVVIPTSPTKTGSMLKGQKTLTPTEATAAVMTDFRESLGTTKELLQTIAALQQRLDALENRQEQEEAPPVEEPTEPEPVHYDEQATMSMILSAAIPQIIESFKVVIDGPDSEEEEPATHINASGLYLTLTELDETLRGIKAYVSECIEKNEEVDMGLLEAYAQDFKQAAEQLETKHALPVMAEQIVVKRFLTGRNAVKRPVWKRPSQART